MKNSVGIQNEIYIVDDGTLDTVVYVNGELVRYDSEYRFSFENDEQFIETIKKVVVGRAGIELSDDERVINIYDIID
tara:strand:- start:62 stop:292 length:231 start_codon:yes stop_codon:yes gene_type:complete